MIYENIQADIKDAMLTKNTVKRDCLRTIVSDIKNLTVNANPPKEITDDICIKVIQKSVKTHKDSIEQFTSGNRLDLVEHEKAELEFIEKFLPKMHSELMVQTIILDIINKNKIPETKQSMGRIMKELNMREDKNLIDKKIASQYLAVLLK